MAGLLLALVGEASKSLGRAMEATAGLIRRQLECFFRGRSALDRGFPTSLNRSAADVSVEVSTGNGDAQPRQQQDQRGSAENNIHERAQVHPPEVGPDRPVTQRII